MTNIEILVKCDVSDPNFALALRSAEADELEEALLLTEDQKKLGRIRAALRRSGSRCAHANIRTGEGCTNDFIYFLFQLLIECGEDLCRKCAYNPPAGAEAVCDNLNSNAHPFDMICLQGIKTRFEESEMDGEIYFSEKNIHGE